MAELVSLSIYIAIGLPILIVAKAVYTVRALRSGNYSWKPFACLTLVLAAMSVLGFDKTCGALGCRTSLSFGWVSSAVLFVAPDQPLLAAKMMRIAMFAYLVLPVYVFGHALGLTFHTITGFRRSPG